MSINLIVFVIIWLIQAWSTSPSFHLVINFDWQIQDQKCIKCHSLNLRRVTRWFPAVYHNNKRDNLESSFNLNHSLVTNISGIDIIDKMIIYTSNTWIRGISLVSYKRNYGYYRYKYAYYRNRKVYKSAHIILEINVHTFVSAK